MWFLSTIVSTSMTISTTPSTGRLAGVVLPRVSDGAPVDLGALLEAPPTTTLLVLGTCKPLSAPCGPSHLRFLTCPLRLRQTSPSV